MGIDRAEYLGVFELDNGTYYCEKDGNTLIAGGACNWGIIPEVEIEYDPDISMDANIERLYEAIQQVNN